MKKILTVALMTLMFLLAGCGSNYSDETFLEERTFWVANKEDIDDFIDGAGRGDKGEFDEDFLQQQLLEGRIQFSDKEVKVAVTDELRGGKVVEIKFLQGRYKNKIGYVFPEFIIDVGKERELDLAAKSGTIPINKLPLQYKQAYDSLLGNGIKIDNPQVQPDGHGNYSLVADTNLPYGTRISVAGVETSTGEENFSVKLAAPPGKKIPVRILDEKDQLRNVIAVNAALVKNKGDAYGIFGKEIYIE